MNNDLLKVFETESDYDSAKDGFVYPTVSYVRDVDEIRYMKLLPNYLYIEALADNCEVSFSSSNEVLCSTDGNKWSTLSSDTENVVINQGEKLYIKGECNVIYDFYMGFMIGALSASQPYNVGGNIMSLLFLDNFENVDLTNVNFGFGSCFAYETNLMDASQLILPSVVCGDAGCYDSMFRGCTSLTSAPELPATTLKERCYESMFQDCTSLITAPALPATTLAIYCYNCMFYGCTSLTTAPALPATTLADSCYNCMFYGCKNLNYIKMLATDIPVTNCLDNWVNGVSTNGTFVKNPALSESVIGRGVSGIPNGWTVDDYVAPSGTYLPEYDTNGIDTNFVIGQSYPDVVSVFQSIRNKYTDAAYVSIVVPEQILLTGNGTGNFDYPLGNESLFTNYLSHLTYEDASIVAMGFDLENNILVFANDLGGGPNIMLDLTDGLCQEYHKPGA